MPESLQNAYTYIFPVCSSQQSCTTPKDAWPEVTEVVSGRARSNHQKAPTEGDGDPTARAPLPTLQVQATGDKCPFSPSQRPPTSVSQTQPPLASLAAAAHPPAGHRGQDVFPGQRI